MPIIVPRLKFTSHDGRHEDAIGLLDLVRPAAFFLQAACDMQVHPQPASPLLPSRAAWTAPVNGVCQRLVRTDTFRIVIPSTSALASKSRDSRMVTNLKTCALRTASCKL